MDLPKTISDVHNGLIKGSFSCIELTKSCLAKIKKENKNLNDFLNLTEDLALEQAEKIDGKISRREKIGPLEGVSVAIKDNILVEGYKTTAGSKILEDYVAPYDATVIEKLKKAGAVIIGKTNLDEFAMGSSTENSAFGVVKNPADTSRVPGGSSGGSAVAVAADHCLVALGSDTGGSIRQPAAFCGVVGFKPSYGMISRYGLIAMASSLDQIGPLANNVEDAQLIFNIIKGKDIFDSTNIESKKTKTNEHNLKIGVPKEFFGEGIDKTLKERTEREINKFTDLGFELKEINLPHSEYALAVYYIIMSAEVSANLARYDGIKYGFSAKDRNLLDNYLESRTKGFGDEARRRIMLGTYALSAGYRDAYYNKAQKVRTLIKQDFEKVFSPSADGVDFILAPTTPTPAFKIGEKKDPLSMYLSDIYTVPANLAGLPAISIPCGRVNGLPIGLQIIGPQFNDHLVLEIAQIYEQSNQ
ncbi:MAG: glutaminyl-tRNA synthase (glutamine-hydrolyzing) subunit A [Candidatus Portnoybacteria bacterium RBG_13_40_8]|uniref:Glutamyl-tRNA(Gln) amidotransferase subunit A n=1 Tax=Candidatus Portnoybacteria bacterium RBG_13_40_8 TaxID=1801990 RepID=A0A1G2F1R2_9BACT|nr:MAG: glutaminyl-tRNA synthase (glutamine-hydrolyzing) subunit A [Candidatus Portnoybacteria bacterium RBG_13_40_8]